MSISSNDALSSYVRRVDREFEARFGAREPKPLYEALQRAANDSVPEAAVVTLATHAAFGGDEADVDEAVDPALAVGLLQLGSRVQASLLDAPATADVDVPVEGPVRTILVGDVCYSAAFAALGESDARSDALLEWYRALGRTTAEVNEGLSMATDWDGAALDGLEEAVCRSLGGLYATAFEFGARAAGRGNLDALRECGRHAAVAKTFLGSDALRDRLTEVGLLAAASDRARARRRATFDALARVDAHGRSRLEDVVDGVLAHEES